jgi:hypothetical protein
MKRLFQNPRRARKAWYVLIAALLALVMGATYAFTASNTVPGSNAGNGQGTISGYVVAASSVHYTVNTTNPTNLDSVAFNIDNPAGNVRIQVVNGGSWYNCGAATGSGPYAVTCNTTSPQATVSTANQLTVVAVS